MNTTSCFNGIKFRLLRKKKFPPFYGGHILLHLATNKRIIRRNVTPLPITESIIKQVEARVRVNLWVGLGDMG